MLPKRAFVVLGWVISAALAVSVSISTTYFLRTTRKVTQIPPQQYSTIQQAFAAGLAYTDQQPSIEAADARPILLSIFLKQHKSPLTPYDYWGNYLTQLADLYQMDYRLLPAIAMQESNLCKVIPEGSYNCLGLGVHSKGTWEFKNFEENFDAAARILKKEYLDKGLRTPEEIQTKYTPSSNGSWQFAINHFMDKIASGYQK
jgi:hypothetical protein